MFVYSLFAVTLDNQIHIHLSIETGIEGVIDQLDKSLLF